MDKPLGGENSLCNDYSIRLSWATNPVKSVYLHTYVLSDTFGPMGAAGQILKTDSNLWIYFVAWIKEAHETGG